MMGRSPSGKWSKEAEGLKFCFIVRVQVLTEFPLFKQILDNEGKIHIWKAQQGEKQSASPGYEGMQRSSKFT